MKVCDTMVDFVVENTGEDRKEMKHGETNERWY